MEDMVAAATDEAAGWAGGLDELVERIAPRFRRIAPRRRVRACPEGLRAPVERKNGWQLAGNAGDRTPDAVQDFLARMRWDADRVRDDPGLRRGELRIPMMSATCSDRSRPAVPNDVGRGGGAPAGRL